MAEGCVPARERPVARGSSHTISLLNPPTHSLCSSDACGGHGEMHMGDLEAINGLVIKEHCSFYILSLFNMFNVWVLTCPQCSCQGIIAMYSYFSCNYYLLFRYFASVCLTISSVCLLSRRHMYIWYVYFKFVSLMCWICTFYFHRIVSFIYICSFNCIQLH